MNLRQDGTNSWLLSYQIEVNEENQKWEFGKMGKARYPHGQRASQK